MPITFLDTLFVPMYCPLYTLIFFISFAKHKVDIEVVTIKGMPTVQPIYLFEVLFGIVTAFYQLRNNVDILILLITPFVVFGSLFPCSQIVKYISFFLICNFLEFQYSGDIILIIFGSFECYMINSCQIIIDLSSKIFGHLWLRQ